MLRPARRVTRRATAKPTEHVEQTALARWLTLRRLIWCHVPNGGLRSWPEARRFKQLGVMAGVPDILIFSRPRATGGGCCPYAGTAVELKRQGIRTASPEQQAWLVTLQGLGWAARVCSGAQEAITWLESLGY